MTLHDTSSAQGHSSLPCGSQLEEPGARAPVRLHLPPPTCQSDRTVKSEVAVCTLCAGLVR